jgi:hypothetical protein
MQAVIAIPPSQTRRQHGGTEQALMQEVAGVPLLIRVVATAMRPGVDSVLVIWPVDVDSSVLGQARRVASSVVAILASLMSARGSYLNFVGGALLFFLSGLFDEMDGMLDRVEPDRLAAGQLRHRRSQVSFAARELCAKALLVPHYLLQFLPRRGLGGDQRFLPPAALIMCAPRPLWPHRFRRARR